MFLGIDNRAKGIARTDAAFWGYATEVPKFVLGCEEYWGSQITEMHNKMRDKNEQLRHPREVP